MQCWGVTDPGCVRSQNQDTYLIEQLDRNTVLCVVCDGMGGAKSGNVASTLAAEVFVEEVRQTWIPGMKPDDAEQMLRSAVKLANFTVYDQAQQLEEFSGMGTTLTFLWEAEKCVHLCHVGDSRAYLLRDGEFKQITDDHSLVAELLRNNMISPDAARTHPYRNVITRAVGVDPVVTADLFTHDTQEDDLWLICSDGLTNMVPDETLASVLKEADSDETAADELLALALEKGGTDNITFVLCRITEVAAV